MGKIERKTRLDTWASARYPFHNGHVIDRARNEKAVERDLERAGSLIEVKDPSERIREFAEHMQKPGAAGLVIANHDQHINIAAFLQVLQNVNGYYSGELHHGLILTISLLNGDQGLGLQRFAWGMKPTLEEKGMEMIGIMREKDRVEFYGPGKKSPDELREDMQKSSSNIRHAIKLFLSGGVVWLFPAGTTIEGVIDPETGLANGMCKVNNEFIPMFMNFAKKKNKDLRILPLSLNGHNRIVPARETHPTSEAETTIIRNMVLGRVLGNKYLAEVIPGEMYGIGSLVYAGVDITDGDAVNTYSMRRVAQNVVPERKGIFG